VLCTFTPGGCCHVEDQSQVRPLQKTTGMQHFLLLLQLYSICVSFQRMFVEMGQMASRPFAQVLVEVENKPPEEHPPPSLRRRKKVKIELICLLTIGL